RRNSHRRERNELRCSLRRLSAILLLALFSFSLCSFAFQSDPESKLPACCRRSGSHHCSLASGGRKSGRGFNANDRCPLFPSFVVGPGSGNTLRLTARGSVFAPAFVSGFVPRFVNAHRQGRVVLAHGERGPPSFLFHA